MYGSDVSISRFVFERKLEERCLVRLDIGYPSAKLRVGTNGYGTQNKTVFGVVNVLARLEFIELLNTVPVCG